MSCDLYACYHLGVILKGSGRASFSSQIRTVTFEDVPAAYKPGIPFEGKVIRLINDHWELQPAVSTAQRYMLFIHASGMALNITVSVGCLVHHLVQNFPGITGSICKYK